MKRITLLTIVVGLGLSAAGDVFAAATVTILHSFNFSDGFQPWGELVEGNDGNFYGTTWVGGTTNNSPGLGNGTVFRITPSGTLTTLHLFTNHPDGYQPRGGLVQGSDGNFYGTTMQGGANSEGTVFKISQSGSLTILHSFIGLGLTSGGAVPSAGLMKGSDGDFYGTTEGGGVFGDGNLGTVFRISPSGSLTTLHSFSGSDGSAPSCTLVQGSDGNFYGTTQSGGASTNCTLGCGTVFKITPNGTLTTLHSFSGVDGGNPNAGLAKGSDGNFYGTTQSGGASVNCGTSGCGTVFRISPNGSFTTLHSFNGILDDGFSPWLGAGLIGGSDGNFYGTTFDGRIFRISPSGELATLYQFSGSTNGNLLSAGLVEGSDGNFYGTTQFGGAFGRGIVFKLVTGLGSVDNPLSSGPISLEPDGGFCSTTNIPCDAFFGGNTNGVPSSPFEWQGIVPLAFKAGTLGATLVQLDDPTLDSIVYSAVGREGTTDELNLYLMYDFLHQTTPFGTNDHPTVLFDVAGGRFQGRMLVTLNCSDGTVLVDGFDNGVQFFGRAGSDLGLEGACGFGKSPNPSGNPALDALFNTDHAMFELEVPLTQNLGGAPRLDGGLYDPSPAFWSAGVLGSNRLVLSQNTVGIDVASGASKVTPIAPLGACTITCPANITTNVGAAGTSAVVTFSDPAFNGNCGVTSIECVPPSGSTFGPGTNTVTCTATDTLGNTNTCNFRIFVLQNSGGGSPTATLSKVKQKCKTKKGVTTCRLSAQLALLNSQITALSPTHVRFFLSTDTAYDAGVDTQLSDATSKKIKPHKSGKLKLKTSLGVSASGLFILAVDDSNNVLASIQVP